MTGALFKKFLDRIAGDNPALAEKFRPRYNITIKPDKLEDRIKHWKDTRPDLFRHEDINVAWIKHKDGTWSPVEGWENKPVGGVTFEAAAAYAASLGKRLPTSKEWEKAARGVDGRTYPWGERFDESRAACNRHPRYDPLSGWKIIHSAGTMKEGASPYGALHMAGNLSEWTATDFKGGHKVNRGGCAFDDIQMLRCSSIDYTKPGDNNSALGFRTVRDVK